MLKQLPPFPILVDYRDASWTDRVEDWYPVCYLEIDHVSSTQDNRILGSVWYLVVCVLPSLKLLTSSLDH